MLIVILWLIVHLLSSVSIAKMAKDHEIKDIYLSYIPFSQQYMLGKIADTINKNDNDFSLYRLLYPLLTVITFLGYGFLLVAMLTFDMPMVTIGFLDSGIVVNAVMYMIIFTIISLICLVYLVVLYKCHFVIFNNYSPKYAILYIVLSVFFNIHPVILFLIKDTKTSVVNLLTQEEKFDD